MVSPRQVVTADEMREIEHRWFDSGEITLEALMDRVGRATAEWICDYFDRLGERGNVVALVGKGNNGGDALTASKYLKESGIHCDIVTVLARDPDGLGRSTVPTLPSETKTLCDGADLILDGVFGFGISRPIEEPVASVFRVVNKSDATVVSIDVPSGVDPDTGVADPNAIRCDVTLSVGLTKLGPSVRFGNPGFGNEMTVLDVDIPKPLTKNLVRERIDAELARSLLPLRGLDAHKGDFGRSLLISGSTNYVGAAALATKACVRSGVGLTTLATPETVYRTLAGHIPEATYVPLTEGESGVEPGDASPNLRQLIPQMNSVLMGTGLGLSRGVESLLEELVGEPELWRNCTTVVDADALTLFASIDRWSEAFGGDLIITPHPGEMARLLASSVAEVEADRRSAVEEAATRFNCVAILKGATTLIADPARRLRLNMRPNDGLARGGSGDVLAGLVTGFAAQMDPFDAATLAVYLHSVSGTFARDAVTAYAMTAQDLIRFLPDAFLTIAS